MKIIRRSNSRDLKEILKLLNSSPELIGDKSQPYTEDMVKEYLTNKNFNIFIYEIDKKIIGFVIAQFWKKARYIYIFDIFIKKEYRRKGIATKLMNYIEDTAKKSKMNLIYCHVHKKNINMQALLNKNKYNSGEESIYYSKTLKCHKKNT